MPALVRWPSVIQSGKVDWPVQITDWMPTICSLAGYRPESNLKWDGADITSLLKERKPLPDRPLYAVAPGWSARSLRYGDWKLIVHESKKNSHELYDLSSDPSESKNLADEEPERLQAMLTRLETMASADRDSVASPVK